MSPRVVPKSPEYADALHKRERDKLAAHDYARGKDEALAKVVRDHGIETPGLPTAGPYGPGSERSWFLDLMWASGGEVALRDLQPPNLVGDVGQARERLGKVSGAEYRDLSTGATAGGGFVPSGPPGFIGEAFAASARAASVLGSELPQEVLPETGMTLKSPRITTGASVAVQTAENAAVSETDIVEAMISNPIATIAGQEDLSMQLFDRSDPAMADVVLAKELGRALGAAFDAQVLAGTGASGQMLGLRAVAGIVANTYVDATSTQAEASPVVLKTYADVGTALGQSPDLLLMHPRRNAWFLNWKDTATGAASPIRWPARVVEVPAIATNYGTNEDEIYVLNSSELAVYSSPPKFRILFDVGSGTLTARVSVYQYLSALFSHRPEAIGKISGSGLIAPVFA